MSTSLDEALALSSEEETESSNVLVIDNDLRTITIPESISILGVESDDDTRTLYFQMPKTYEGLDLSEFSVRVNYQNANKEGDCYIVSDATASDDTIMFTWLVGRTACAYKGDTTFIVCLRLVDDDGNVTKEFNTTTAKLPVLEGLETTEQIVQEYPDIIEAIKPKRGTDYWTDEDIATIKAYVDEAILGGTW